MLTFDDWFKKAYPDPGILDPAAWLALRAAAEAAWNDAMQLTLARVVFHVAKKRKGPHPEGAAVAVFRKTLGELMVEISEM